LLVQPREFSLAMEGGPAEYGGSGAQVFILALLYAVGWRLLGAVSDCAACVTIRWVKGS